uniref:Uncharacterized protein n=1 Tax=Timema bartmani TaxID=61472 RepID=A0A7R9EZU9_9NEOP|nr:unnamed protein product [Timema bartmani]
MELFEDDFRSCINYFQTDEYETMKSFVERGFCCEKNHQSKDAYPHLHNERVEKLLSVHPIEIRTSISVISTLVHCKSSAIDQAATEAKTPTQWAESSQVTEPSPACRGGFGKKVNDPKERLKYAGIAKGTKREEAETDKSKCPTCDLRVHDLRVHDLRVFSQVSKLGVLVTGRKHDDMGRGEAASSGLHLGVNLMSLVSMVVMQGICFCWCILTSPGVFDSKSRATRWHTNVSNVNMSRWAPLALSSAHSAWMNQEPLVVLRQEKKPGSETA